LLLRHGSAVLVEELVEAVWGQATPASVVASVRTYVHRLRRLLGERLIRSVGSGYMIETAPGQLDLATFHARLAEARRSRGAGDFPGVVTLLRETLAGWQGSALTDVSGEWADTQRAVLDRLRVGALELLLEAQIELGEHQQAAAELTALVAQNPLDERLRELLMLALSRSGRQAAALAVFHETRTLLADELGVDPCPALRSLYERILRADRTALAHPAPPAPVGSRRRVTIPTRLPPDLPGFSGRAAPWAVMRAVLPPDEQEAPEAGLVSVVTGTAGVGKTAFAVHCAHRLAARFPDGQIYLDLRGFDPLGPPVTTSQALGMVLDALGVPAADQPDDEHAQAALWRSVLADRRILLLLDNARDSRQVRPLLPGTPGSMVIVTSRSQLCGLITRDGARVVQLEPMGAEEARDLLVRRLGVARILAEPEAVTQIIESSAGLPLALALIAARAATRPAFPLAATASELRDTPVRLDAFSHTDSTLDLRTVFSCSYRALTPAAARLFRLLACHVGLDVTLPCAAALSGSPAREVRPLLAELTEANLVTQHQPGRYAPHDLLRSYAAELGREVDPDDERRAALHRVLSYYLHTSYIANGLLSARHPALGLAPLAPGITVEEIRDHRQALAWFAAEQPVLMTAVDHAARCGFPTHAWQLAWTLMEYLQRSGRWRDQIAIQRTALEAARGTDDREGLAHTHRNLARSLSRTDQYQEARDHLGQALGIFAQLGDLGGQAQVQTSLAFVSLRPGNHRQALHHAENALHLFRAADDGPGEAKALNNCAWIHAMLGEYERSLALLEQALSLLQGGVQQPIEAATWDSLGFVHHQLVDHPRAAGCYRRALDLYRELGDIVNEAETLTRLGDTLVATGDHDGARLAFRAALSVFEKTDPAAGERVGEKLRVLTQIHGF
jgi:DNA-binding SARP family transcriptional activator/tetratricopeptide (TPR) repeat protein